jgi:hypothetical protein
MDDKQPENWSPTTEWIHRFRKMLLAFMYSPVTPWFFLGMASEAFGLSIQKIAGWPTIPEGDFIVGVIIGMFLLYWQNKYPLEECLDADESEDEDAD